MEPVVVDLARCRASLWTWIRKYEIHITALSVQNYAPEIDLAERIRIRDGCWPGRPSQRFAPKDAQISVTRPAASEKCESSGGARF